MYKYIKHVRIFLVGICLTILLIIILTAGLIILLFHQLFPLLTAAPTLLGMHGQKTYLILFQNNMELRPGGGFIGSYGLISFKNGKMMPLTVHNTYDADGLLQKHVEPYFIGRRYIQVHLYMRDSNFDVDFAKSAEKAAYMLQEETGIHADGVVAIDTSFVKSIVALLSPIYVWQYNTTVTPSNFFILTEARADRYSFYGSTQKQDFLRDLYDNMATKLRSNVLNYFGVIQKIFQGIEQKHVLFALDDPHLERVLSQNNLSSTLYDPRKHTPGVINDFLGINEANIGVNKANYFLTRRISQQTTINASGAITEHVTLTYTNSTQTEKWPSGRYVVYIRLILPDKAKLQEISIDGKSQKIIPAVTDFRVYEAKDFVPPDGLEVDSAKEEGKMLYGFITIVWYHSTKKVDITYALADKVDMHAQSLQYSLVVFKQPGMDNDSYTYSLVYPKTYATITIPSGFIQKTPGIVLYVSSLLTDKHIDIGLAQ